MVSTRRSGEKTLETNEVAGVEVSQTWPGVGPSYQPVPEVTQAGRLLCEVWGGLVFAVAKLFFWGVE